MVYHFLPNPVLLVYACHVLEHLALNDFRLALKNTYKILSPGGIFRLIVPDLEILCRVYLESDKATAAEEFMLATHLGIVKRERGFLDFLISWIGNSSHLWMWDSKSLKNELPQIGFINIRRAAYGDSEDPMFRDVEERSRFENAVAIECRKPQTS